MSHSRERNAEPNEVMQGTEAFTEVCVSAKKELESLRDYVGAMPTGKDANMIKKHLDNLSKALGKLSC